MKNNVFDKSGYKKNVNSILWPIMDGSLTPTIYFNIVIYITASMKTLGLPGNPKWPPKLPKMFLTQNHYIINNNWKLRDFLAWYLSPTVNFDNMVPISYLYKNHWPWRKSRCHPLSFKKMYFLQKLEILRPGGRARIFKSFLWKGKGLVIRRYFFLP